MLYICPDGRSVSVTIIFFFKIHRHKSTLLLSGADFLNIIAATEKAVVVGLLGLDGWLVVPFVLCPYSAETKKGSNGKEEHNSKKRDQ